MRPNQSPFLSVLPRVEQLFWGLRGLALCGLSLYLASGGSTLQWGRHAWILAGAYAVVVVVPLLLIHRLRVRFRQVFWPMLVLDVLAIAWLIRLTGGIGSDVYLVYYALVSFVAYYAGLSIGLLTAACVTAVYAFACFFTVGLEALPVFVFRVVILSVFTVVLGLMGRFVHVFAQRLLSAMDKLNERTSELERTGAQLETIYETSRSLAEILSVENVVDRVLIIARSVLSYPVCEIYTWDAARRTLWLKGRMAGTETQRLERPALVEPCNVFRRVIESCEIVRVANRQATRSVLDGQPARSQLVVPMVSEGKLIGLLNAESPRVNAFSERDERVFSILAASTAMALVNADLHEQMEKLVIVDELTGVYNYRHFKTRLEEEKRRAARYQQPLSLVMVDIDWFKSLNDRFGHQAGNVALRQLARVIGGCIRDVDTLARYGGEEFMAILPQTGPRDARVIGDRIREQVERAEFGPDSTGRPIHLTVSVGISSYPDNGLPEDEIVESVDQALYRAKGSGKNAVCTAGV